jgi:hypothetical protein
MKKYLRQKLSGASKPIVHRCLASDKPINPACLWHSGRLISSTRLTGFSHFYEALTFSYFLVKQKVQDKKTKKECNRKTDLIKMQDGGVTRQETRASNTMENK